MGRPRASSSNRDFAASFANCVTVFSVQEFDWVARRGRYGIFELMRLLAPKVTKEKCVYLNRIDILGIDKQCAL
jgi:hypothetical protein